jgi:hypothetical protein
MSIWTISSFSCSQLRVRATSTSYEYELRLRATSTRYEYELRVRATSESISKKTATRSAKRAKMRPRTKDDARNGRIAWYHKKACIHGRLMDSLRLKVSSEGNFVRLFLLECAWKDGKTAPLIRSTTQHF